MAFEQVVDLDCATSTAIGGRDKKTGKANPISAEGYFIGTRQVESKLAKSGFCSLHVLQTPKGNLGVWGKTDMDQKLKGVVPGTMIRVTFTGMQPTKKQDMFKYKVEIDKDNCIDVGGLSGEAQSAPEGESQDDAQDYNPEEGEEQSLDAEAPPADEPSPARPVPPKQSAKVPDAARQAQVQALLNRSRAAKSTA